MFLNELPTEMVLKIIYKLNYIDVLQLYLVSNKFKNIIEEYLYSIYLHFEKNSRELCWYPSYQTTDWHEAFNFKIFSNIYVDSIKKKKEALIIIRYIHKWVVNELIDSPMDRSAVPNSMAKATYIFLSCLCPNTVSKNKEISSRDLSVFTESIIRGPLHSHRFIKDIIEKYIPEDLLNSINISRITVDGFRIFEKFNFENPQIYIYNKDFTCKHKYEIKITKYDTKIFNVM